MNDDQRANINKMVTGIAETLFSAWSYFHLLQGFHEGSKAYPVVIQKFDRLFEQVWRAVFDGLFVKAGTLVDSKKGTFSLPSLVSMVRRYGDNELKTVAKSVDGRLTAKDGPLVKLKSWRHLAVAHCTQNGRLDAFYDNNQMNLEEVAEILRELEALLNILSLELLAVHNNIESGSGYLIQQGKELFASINDAKAVCPTSQLT